MPHERPSASARSYTREHRIASSEASWEAKLRPVALLISPEAAGEGIQDHEPAEEESSDEGHEPYDAQQNIDCLQNDDRPFVRPLSAGIPPEPRKSRDGRI